MPLFERHHQGCELVFMFDNSGNHHKKTPGGLWAWDRTLKDGGKVDLQRDGWWVDAGGVRRVQSMQLPPLPQNPDKNIAKGLISILGERNNWNYTISVEAARARLAAYPDFVEQQEWLAETVQNAGHTIDYYPKFHCELNFIEMVWAYCKAQLRRKCTYNFPAMRAALPDTLHEVPLSFHRRALRHCFRFMSGYRKGLHGPILDYVMRKYKGHRTIPLFVGRELQVLEEEYIAQRLVKIESRVRNL